MFLNIFLSSSVEINATFELSKTLEYADLILTNNSLPCFSNLSVMKN